MGLALAMRIFKELWRQATLAASEVEDHVANWLYEQLGMVMPASETSPPPALFSQAPSVHQTAAPLMQSNPNPTRPVDWLMVILLGLNLRRPPPGGVG